MLHLAWNSAAQYNSSFITGEVYVEISDESLPEYRIPSFEEFREASRIGGVGGDTYVVEFDIWLYGDEELKAYYQTRFYGYMDKSAVKLRDASDPLSYECIYNPETTDCIDDVYENDEQYDLKYCVSDDWGASKNHIIDGVAKAVQAWHEAGGVEFVYHPEGDSNCTTTSPVPSSVDFKVAPVNGSYACSFSPGGRFCGSGLGFHQTLVYGTSTSGTWAVSKGWETSEMMAHELGHTLGLKHEFLRFDADPECGGGGPSRGENRPLTEFDRESIMMYPSGSVCELQTFHSEILSKLDGEGIRTLYGSPPAWYTIF